MSAIALVLKNLTSKNKKLVSENQKLKQKITKLEQSNKEIKKELNEFKLSDRYNTKITNIHKASINKRKANVKKILLLINNELSKINYAFDHVYIKDKNDHNMDVGLNFSIEYLACRESQYHTALKCLYFKDLAGMSDRNYKIFRKGMALGPKISPLGYLHRKRKTYSINLDLNPLSTGFYINPIVAIRERLEHYLNQLPRSEAIKMKTLMVKVSCDGTNLSRNVKVVNVVFNFINEKLKAATASGCYRIGIFKIDK
jgi:hypothetical protein